MLDCVGVVDRLGAVELEGVVEVVDNIGLVVTTLVCLGLGLLEGSCARFLDLVSSREVMNPNLFVFRLLVCSDDGVLACCCIEVD